MRCCRHLWLSACLLCVGLLLVRGAAHAADAASPDSGAFQEARALFVAQRYPEARLAFEQLAVVGREPDNPRVHYYLGRIAMKRSDAPVAVSHFERATQLAPENSGYFAELGGAYALALDEAAFLKKAALARKVRAALEHAVALDSGNLDAQEGLIDYYSQAPGFLGGGQKKALAQAEELRRHDLARGTAALAELYRQAHDLARAVGVYEVLLRAQPQNAPAHYALGRLAEAAGDRPKARRAYEAALALAPDLAAAQHALENL